MFARSAWRIILPLVAAAFGRAWALRTSNPVNSRNIQRQRGLIVVEGGRTASPLGRVSTPAGKQARVQELSEAIGEATLIFSFKGEGLNIKVLNDLRNKLPETSKAAIAKNTLMKRAGAESGWSDDVIDGSAHMFKGQNLWIFSGEDMKATVNAYESWVKENGLKDGGYDIRGGFFEGSHVDDKGVKAAIDLPTKPELMARLAAAINLAGPLGIARNIKNAKGNAQGLAVRLKKASGGKLAIALKVRS